MMTLFQAATMPQGFTVGDVIRTLTPFALAVLGWMQARSAADRAEMRSEIKAARDEIKVIRDQVIALNAHVGVDGNGIMARLDKMESKIDVIFSHIMQGRPS